MNWLLSLSLVVCTLAIAGVAAAAYGSRQWSKLVLTLKQRLEAGRVSERVHPSRPTRYHRREIEGLPAPVQRYFRAVLKDGQPIIAAATVELAGAFNMSATSEQWKRFTSWQRVVTRRPGFLWDAKVYILPGLAVRVLDSYIAGKGLLHAALLGLFTVAGVRGEGEIARGEFMRFFAETAWYPTALLPSQGVRWEAIDEHSANATIVDGPLTLSLLFRFNQSGLIDSFHATARGAVDGAEMVMLPWEGKWSNYQTHDGMTLPFTGEVAWVRPQGRRSYFQGTVISLTYAYWP